MIIPLHELPPATLEKVAVRVNELGPGLYIVQDAYGGDYDFFAPSTLYATALDSKPGEIDESQEPKLTLAQVLDNIQETLERGMFRGERWPERFVRVSYVMEVLREHLKEF